MQMYLDREELAKISEQKTDNILDDVDEEVQEIDPKVRHCILKLASCVCFYCLVSYQDFFQFIKGAGDGRLLTFFSLKYENLIS